MENRNPLEKVRFYKKDELDKAFKLKKEQVCYQDYDLCNFDLSLLIK
jgi:hypothetical protein